MPTVGADNDSPDDGLCARAYAIRPYRELFARLRYSDGGVLNFFLKH